LTIPDPVELSNVFRQVASEVGPAVVHINTTSTVDVFAGLSPFGDLGDLFGGADPFGGEAPTQRGLGSGFIVDASGYIITNNHVIDGANEINVILADSDEEFDATVVGIDPLTDLAVIRIDAGRALPVARLGNSDSMQPGDWVLALGSPFGFDNSLTAGIVSAIGRQEGQFQRFIQTDAAINPGNSGGPLVNMSGEVIGINTAIITSTESFAGIGFALPSNTAVTVYNQISATGKVTRGSIGIGYDDVPTTLRALGFDYGVLVTDVTLGGPAESAGVEKYDVITGINGTRISDGDVLLDIVSSQPLGATITLELYRAGEEQARSLDVTIDDRSVVHSAEATGFDRPSTPEPQDTRLGMQVQEIPAELRRSLPAGTTGVMVVRVTANGPAADAGLSRGVLITEMVQGRGRPADITSVAEFRRLERGRVSGSTVLLGGLLQAQDGEWRSGPRPVVVP
jgi:serine protease Do